MGFNDQLLYPDRKRCARCRSYFCWEVIYGLFCSRVCARIPPISSKPADWPRCHYSERNGQRRPKHSFYSLNSARKFIRRQPEKQVYRCSYCWEIHIGSADPDKVYPPHPQMPL